MRQQFVADRPTRIHLPWLEPRNSLVRIAEMEGSVSLSHVDVPTDTAIFVDPDSERARFLMPDGKIESWKSLTQVQIALDLKLWLVTWRTIGEAPETCFGICQRDGRYEIIVEFFEGREIELFPEFMRLILDQFHNPGGFLLPDGRYRSNMGVSFDLEFGLSGGVPRCTAVEETISVQPEFPYETVISLPSDAEIFDMAVKGVRQVRAGSYFGRVMSWHGGTGAVHMVKYQSENLDFTIDGEQLIRFIHDGKLVIEEIVQDRFPNY